MADPDKEAARNRVREWAKGKAYTHLPGILDYMAYVLTHDKQGHPTEEGGPPSLVGFNEAGEVDLDRAYELAVSVLGARVLQ